MSCFYYSKKYNKTYSKGLWDAFVFNADGMELPLVATPQLYGSSSTSIFFASTESPEM